MTGHWSLTEGLGATGPDGGTEAKEVRSRSQISQKMEATWGSPLRAKQANRLIADTLTSAGRLAETPGASLIKN